MRVDFLQDRKYDKNEIDRRAQIWLLWEDQNQIILENGVLQYVLQKRNIKIFASMPLIMNRQ